jgi:hypothetical protein
MAGLFAALGGALLVHGADAAETTSGNWSGYVLKSPRTGENLPTETFSFVRSKWVQPKVVCSVPDARVSIWVGIDGWGTDTVEQVGTFAVCGSGAAPLSYTAFWEMVGSPKNTGAQPFNVAPGDSIEASVTYASGAFTLTLTDQTSGKKLSTVQHCAAESVCERASAEWIVERPGSGAYPLADYDKVVLNPLVYVKAGAISQRLVVNMEHSGKVLSSCRVNGRLTCQWVAASD